MRNTNRKRIVNCLSLLFLLMGISIAFFAFINLRETDHQKTDGGSGDDRLVVGYVKLPETSEWWDEFNASLKEEAEKQNMHILEAAAEWDQESVADAIRTLIVYQVDAIVFCPVVSGGWDYVLTEARNAQIPVFTFLNELTTEVQNSIVGTVTEDIEAEGTEIIAYIDTLYEKEKHPVNLIIFGDAVGAPRSIALNSEIRKITRTGVGDDRRGSVCYSVNIGQNYNRAYEVADRYAESSYQKKKPDLIICFNDVSVYAVVDAFREHNIDVGGEVRILSLQDSSAVNLLYESGVVNALFRSEHNMGGTIIAEVDAYLKDGRTSGERILSSELVKP